MNVFNFGINHNQNQQVIDFEPYFFNDEDLESDFLKIKNGEMDPNLLDQNGNTFLLRLINFHRQDFIEMMRTVLEMKAVKKFQEKFQKKKKFLYMRQSFQIGSQYNRFIWIQCTIPPL